MPMQYSVCTETLTPPPPHLKKNNPQELQRENAIKSRSDPIHVTWI